jgi:hypothetical protein
LAVMAATISRSRPHCGWARRLAPQSPAAQSLAGRRAGWLAAEALQRRGVAFKLPESGLSCWFAGPGLRGIRWRDIS